MKELTVYSIPGCPHCKDAKEFLKSKNVKFKEVDVTKDDKIVDMLEKLTGQLQAPVIVLDKKFVVGFDREKIEKLIK